MHLAAAGIGGGDGAVVTEQYLAWVDKQGYCVNKTNYTIDTSKDNVAAQRARPAAERTCLSAAEEEG